MMPPWHHWGNSNIQDGVQDGRQRDKVNKGITAQYLLKYMG